MFEKGDQVVLSNGDICTILECRGQCYDTRRKNRLLSRIR